MKKLEVKIGDKFGEWTIIDINVPSKNKSRYVKCQCSCGNIKEVQLSALRTGKTTCCKSCSARKNTTILKIGTKYKHWTVLEGPIYKKHTAYYKVKCDCGTELLKLPIEIIDPNRDFECHTCAIKRHREKFMVINGKIGDLTLTQHTRLKRSAEKRGYEFSVSIEYLWNLFLSQHQICAITGDIIPNIKEASLDRIDSSKGYIEGNVQWVTYRANVSKHTMSMSELYDFCKKVLNHANLQPSTPLTKCEGSETNS